MPNSNELDNHPPLEKEIGKKVLLPQFCQLHSTAITHLCLQSDCKSRLLCLQCNAKHDNIHHKRIYALNTALNDDQLSLLFNQVEDKYSHFSNTVDEKIEDVIKSGKFIQNGLNYSRSHFEESKAGNQRNVP